MKAPPIRIIARVAAALLGGYVFVWGFVTLGIASLLSLGMPYGDARTLVFLIAFLVLLVVFCWSFVAASLARVWMVLAGGAAIMSGLAWLLMRTPMGA
jgi:hypothetical protein